MKKFVFRSTHECTIKTGPADNRRVAAFNHNFFAITEKNAAEYGITPEQWRDELLETPNARSGQIKLTAGEGVKQDADIQRFDAEADAKAEKRKPKVRQGPKSTAK